MTAGRSRPRDRLGDGRRQRRYVTHGLPSLRLLPDSEPSWFSGDDRSCFKLGPMSFDDLGAHYRLLASGKADQA